MAHKGCPVEANRRGAGRLVEVSSDDRKSAKGLAICRCETLAEELPRSRATEAGESTLFAKRGFGGTGLPVRDKRPGWLTEKKILDK